MNGLSDDGARLVGRALVENDTLQELNISGNRIGIGGAWHVANALEKNNTLHTLRVRNSEIRESSSLSVICFSGRSCLDGSSMHQPII